MGNYRIWQCKHCESSIIANSDDGGWGGFENVNAAVPCCDSPSIGWAHYEDMYIPMDIDIPDNNEIHEPEPPRPSRVELVLQDFPRTCYHG